MEIVPADPAQATALRDVHVTTWEATYRRHASEAWYREGLAAHAVRDWEEIVRSQSAEGGGVLTANYDGRTIGLCQYGPTRDRDRDPRRVGQIHRLYVLPERQRTGVGRALLAASLDRLLQSGVHEADLWVLEADRRARAFYERLGWKPDGARTPGIPTDLRYRLPLRRSPDRSPESKRRDGA